MNPAVAGPNNFPLWVAPEQVRGLTLNDEQRLVTYAQEIIQQLRAEQVHVESDLGPDPIKARIVDAEQSRVHTMFVIGGRDLDAGKLQFERGQDKALLRCFCV